MYVCKLPGAIDDVILGLEFLQDFGSSMAIGHEIIVLSTGHLRKSAENQTGSTSNTVRVLTKALTEPQTQKLASVYNYSVTQPPLSDNQIPIAHMTPSTAQEAIAKFIEHELSLFDNNLGVPNHTEHRIIIKDNRPSKQRYYLRNPAMQAIIDAEIYQLIAKGCIEQSNSP